MQKQKPVPAVGTVIRCSQKDVQFLGSNVPVLRVVYNSGAWAISEDPKRGLHVYITEPAHIALNRLSAVRITAVDPQVAYAQETNV